jgi:hypothetical protein
VTESLISQKEENEALPFALSANVEVFAGGKFVVQLVPSFHRWQRIN